MNKYAVRYCEILARTVIVESDTYEEAEEKVQAAVDDGRIVLDAEDYSECEIKPSLTFGKRPIPDGEDISYYEYLNVYNMPVAKGMELERWN